LSDFISDFKYEIISLVNSFGEFDVSMFKEIRSVLLWLK